MVTVRQVLEDGSEAAAGRELERRLLQATFLLDAAREERAPHVTSAAGVRHRTVEAGQGRGLASVFGPVRVTRMAYRHGHEENLYPADARAVMPGDPYSMGLRALTAFHLASAGCGSAMPSCPGSRGASPRGRMTSTRSAPATPKRKSSRRRT